jgi:hypothetical protein
MLTYYIVKVNCFILKGHGNEADFLGFLQKLVPHESLTIPFEPFRFWLRIRRDIHIRKTTPRYHRYGKSPTPHISDSGNRQLPDHWYVESPTPRITDTRSRRLPASPIRRVGYWIFKKKTLCIDDTESRRLPAPVIWWVADSPYRWVGECRLRVSPILRVDDSAYRLAGELTTPRIGDTGSRYSKKKLIRQDALGWRGGSTIIFESRLFCPVMD